MQMNASMVAREALRQLAQRRLLPTPDNYTRIYYEIAAPDGKHVSLAPVTMLRELAETLIRRGNDGAEEAHALGRAIDISDWHEAKALLLRMASTSAERAGDRTVNIVAERDHGAWAPLIRDIVRQWD